MSHEPNRPFDEDEDPFADDDFADDDFADDDFGAEEWNGEAPLPYSAHDEPRGDNGETLEDLDEDEPTDAYSPAFADGDPFESDPFDDDDPFEIPRDIAPGASARCSGCGTTWDRIRHDGRAGCAACYLEFREQLTGVMARVQRGESHTGKTPRAIEKRHRRLQHLRKRRDNQLAVLQVRLQHAVSSEKYEEAARLRDKIKIVTSTIVS